MTHFSFAVTAFEETCDARRQGRRLLETLAPAQAHEAIDEIVVVDDGSSDYERLGGFLDGQPKVNLYHNVENRGVFGNKIEAIARAKGEWVITCDSDNQMGPAFLNTVTALAIDSGTWYCPSFGKPKFDYRHLIGRYNLANIRGIMDKSMFECAMNTGNQTVHRGRFMEVFEKYRGRRADLMMPNWLNLQEGEREKVDPWRLVFDACDSFILNLEWLKAGNRMKIVEGMEYDHYYSGGPESNYARSPKEKEDLSRLLIAELRQLAKS